MESLKRSYHRYLRYFLAKDNVTATLYDKYMALSYAIRSEMVDKWIETQKAYHEHNPRRVYFLSLEYSFGKSLRQNIINLGIEKSVLDVAADLGFSMEELYNKEDDFELGNNERATIASAFQDTMASLGIPAMGYGLRYDYAQFKQEIVGGKQEERPYDWLHKGHPWEVLRPEYSCSVNFGGVNKPLGGEPSFGRCDWVDTEVVHAIPYDVPIVGYKHDTVNTLRLWSARAIEQFLPDYANHGDYMRACEEKSHSSTITRLLIPEEDVFRATELRLRQQYFFISASLWDIVRRYKAYNANLTEFDKKVSIQLSGSNCALAIPELMRLLIDQEGLAWNAAWEVTRKVFVYTSMIMTREEFENWPVYMIAQLLPRHMQIIFEINQWYIDMARSRGFDSNTVIPALSVIAEGEVKRIRMEHLAVLGSAVVTGVSGTQSALLKNSLFTDFSTVAPEKFQSQSYGIMHRRWLLSANRPLSAFIEESIGNSWISDPQKLVKLEEYLENDSFLLRFGDIKFTAKSVLAGALRRTLGIDVKPQWLFDVQCRKIHQGKRQVLNVLNIIHRYLRIKKGEDIVPSRVYLFSGKAAPSDLLGKQVIFLIHTIAKIINNDPQTKAKMQVVFIPDYSISWAEKIIPAADCAEQISVPHLEPCGTSAIKFACNGTVLVASRGGINLELINRIGEENMFAFGNNESHYRDMQGRQYPGDLIAQSPALKDVFTFLDQAVVSTPDGHRLMPLISSLRDADRHFVLYDFADYAARHDAIDKAYQNKQGWLRMAMLQIARAGYFSCDRVVADYAANAWKVTTE